MNAHLAAHRAALDKLDAVIPLVEALAADCIASIKAGGKILLFGNGGSAADAQHWAAELTGRYRRERIALPAIALTTDTSALTAIGNDYGFDEVFARQVRALARDGDVLIGITTSGTSPNVIAAIKANASRACIHALVTGDRAPGMSLLDHVIRAPGDSTATVQEMHGIIGHMLCGIIEDAFAE
jgi:D-sedoheptulose 7-phosphate isomerase